MQEEQKKAVAAGEDVQMKDDTIKQKEALEVLANRSLVF